MSTHTPTDKAVQSHKEMTTPDDGLITTMTEYRIDKLALQTCFTSINIVSEKYGKIYYYTHIIYTKFFGITIFLI